MFIGSLRFFNSHEKGKFQCPLPYSVQGKCRIGMHVSYAVALSTQECGFAHYLAELAGRATGQSVP